MRQGSDSDIVAGLRTLTRMTATHFFSNLMPVKVVFVLWLLASQSFAAPGVDNHEVVIGGCSVLTGPNAAMGIATTQGAKAYFAWLNARGGVHGRKIRFALDDDKYNVNGEAIACFNRQATLPVFVSGFPVSSAAAVKYVQLAQENKLPFVGFYTGATFITDPVQRYIFATHPSYLDETRALIDHVWNDLKIKRIAVLYQDDAFGASILRGVNLVLKERGATPVSIGSYPRTTTDVADAIVAVRQGNPDAVFFGSTYASAALVVKKAQELGWKPLFVSPSVIGTEAFVQAAGPAAQGVVISQVVPPHDRVDLPMVRDYRDAIAKFTPGVVPSFPGLQGFVNAFIIAQGLEGAGRDLTREKFVDALESIHRRDVGLGSDFFLDYSPVDHRGFHTVYFTIVKDGHIRMLGNWSAIRHVAH